jgi:hypothetical protein
MNGTASAVQFVVQSCDNIRCNCTVIPEASLDEVAIHDF